MRDLLWNGTMCDCGGAVYTVSRPMAPSRLLGVYSLHRATPAEGQGQCNDVQTTRNNIPKPNTINLMSRR